MALIARTSAAPVEAKQFAFWIGEWRCEGTLYGQNQTKTAATNRVTMDFGGHVVHEHFSMKGLNGESWSVYVPAAKKWRQTWVDDSGAYIALEGEFADGKMVLATLPNPARPKYRAKMTFYNIVEKSFDWDWETSQDDGATWKLSWRLHYTRKK